MSNLLVGVIMGFVASVLVQAGLILYAVSRAKRFGPLMVTDRHEMVVLMFDAEATDSSPARRFARSVIGSVDGSTCSYMFPPDAAYEIAKRIAQTASEIQLRTVSSTKVEDATRTGGFDYDARSGGALLNDTSKDSPTKTTTTIRATTTKENEDRESGGEV